MIRLGPIWILSKRERAAYRVLANAAYALHQAIWYTDEQDAQHWEVVKALDADLSRALSYVPASDIDSTE